MMALFGEIAHTLYDVTLRYKNCNFQCIFIREKNIYEKTVAKPISMYAPFPNLLDSSGNSQKFTLLSSTKTTRISHAVAT